MSDRYIPCCPECGAEEPYWNATRADPDSKSAEIERLRAALKAVCACEAYYIHPPRGHIVPDEVMGAARSAIGYQQKGSDGK